MRRSALDNGGHNLDDAPMHRTWMQVCAWVSFVAVVLGAFGAHGLKSFLADHPDAALRISWWETGARYHLIHGVALGLVAMLAGQRLAWANAAGVGWLVGMLLFSGSLYVMALTGMRWLGAVTPLGGLGFLIGWVFVALSARGLPSVQ